MSEKKLANSEKAKAISEFGELKFTEAGRKILNLLDVLIDETRIDNDTAEPMSVSINQGKISVLLALKKYLLREQ